MNERSIKGKLNYASIQISFAAKEYPLIVAIRTIIGHGSITKKKHLAAYVYTINNLDGLIKVAGLINGLLRTPKIYDFNMLITYINRVRGDPHKNLIALPLDNSSLESNSWLTGFIEGDGSFQVRTSLSTKYRRLGLYFELTQARINHDGESNYLYMQNIASFLHVNVNPIRENRKFSQYRVRTSTITSNTILVKYLTKYPLRGTKYLDYID